MKRLVSRLVAGLVVGVAVYVGFSIWADVGQVGQALRSFHWRYALLACLLAAVNYALRFLRWQFYLRKVGVTNVSTRDSLQVFLAGFALTVTPGKLGEAVKAVLLRASHGDPDVEDGADRHRRTDHRSGRAACCSRWSASSATTSIRAS